MTNLITTNLITTNLLKKKYLVYYGSQFDNIPVFNSNLNIDIWQKYLTQIKKDGSHVSNTTKVYYYKLNNIDIIDTFENTRKMVNISDFKMEKISSEFLKIKYTETCLDFILPEFDYYNKQLHQLQIFSIDNLYIYFDEYTEHGNTYHTIYSIVDNENDIIKFINLINSAVRKI